MTDTRKLKLFEWLIDELCSKYVDDIRALINALDDLYFTGSEIIETLLEHEFLVPAGFIDDAEKMRDFPAMSKAEFLRSYSYLTDEDYEDTLRYWAWVNRQVR